ncbi:hypothetical protein [Massilia oculi]|uniref:hypothetical protein n=1 Tax=Massilia oculi TaxID=945844 RepID=UPI001AAED500|nr:hypothetical protein [Massilia oculi]
MSKERERYSAFTPAVSVFDRVFVAGSHAVARPKRPEASGDREAELAYLEAQGSASMDAFAAMFPNGGTIEADSEFLK